METTKKPHSPCVAEREERDGGFSQEWGLHFLPRENSWTDVHAHFAYVKSKEQMIALLDELAAKIGIYGLHKTLVITSQDDCFEMFADCAREDGRFAWMYWPDEEIRDASLIRKAVENYACGIKLHNYRLMKGEIPRDIWFRDPWPEIFSVCQENEIPLLWHITQRQSRSLYTGGGENSYWSEGWKNGVDFTNEDLLQDVLSIMEKYPKLKVVGAHQIHTGPDRLAALFEAYENLYTDTSCGFTLRWADDFIEEDRVRLKAFVEKYSGRILFGTDMIVNTGNPVPDDPTGHMQWFGYDPENPGKTNIDDTMTMGFCSHARFILRLGLHHEALQDVAWRTAQKVFTSGK